MQQLKFDAADIREHRLLAACSYISFLCIVSLALRGKSAFTYYHARQGLVLFLAELILSLVNVIPVLGAIVWLLASIYFVVMSITGFRRAYAGCVWEMPILNKYVSKIKI
jgi:uncharacterized membrane protein